MYLCVCAVYVRNSDGDEWLFAFFFSFALLVLPKVVEIVIMVRHRVPVKKTNKRKNVKGKQFSMCVRPRAWRGLLEWECVCIYLLRDVCGCLM